MFVGDTPIGFLLEIIFRTFIMYGYTIILLRFLGKRGMGQLSTLELAIIISFGSAIGDPMMTEDVPILHGIVAVTTVAFLQVGMERVINKHKKVERIMEGKASCVVDDGLINLDQLDENNLSHEDLMRSLRSNQVVHLGQVYKAFFETSGNLSVLFQKEKNVRPGLSVVPSEFHTHHQPGEIRTKTTFYSCTNCGYTRAFEQDLEIVPCSKCNCEKWCKSVMPDA